MPDFSCPFCGKPVRAPDSMIGRKGRCPGCREVFVIGQPGPAPPDLPPAPPPEPGPLPGLAQGPVADRGGPPIRGWIAVGLLAAMMAVLFTMPEFGQTIRSTTAITILTVCSFVVLTGIFLLAFGPQMTPPRVVLACFGVTFVSAIFVCLIVGWVAYWVLGSVGGIAALRFGFLLTRFRTRGKAIIVIAVVMFFAFCLAVARYSDNFWLSLMGNVVGTGLLEETVKLAPVCYFMVKGKIFTRRSALLCGAFSGLGFGLIESIWYTYQMYIPFQLPASVFLLRFFGLAASHALWTSIAAAALLTLRMRGVQADRPWALFLLAIACSSIVHGLHNAFATVRWEWAGLVIAVGVVAALALLMRQGWQENPPADRRDAAAPVGGLFARYLLPLGVVAGLFCLAPMVVSAYLGETSYQFASAGSGQFELDWPGDWDVGKDEDGDLVGVSPAESPDDGFFESIYVAVEDLRPGTELKEYGEACRSDLRRQVHGLRVDSVRSARLGPLGAERMVIAHTSEGLRIKQLIYLLIEGDKGYLVVCTATEESYDAWEPRFEGICRTLRIK